MLSGDDSTIVIAGTGAVGGFVGGLLAGAGRQVALFGREEPMRQLSAEGLRLTDRDGLDLHVAPTAFTAGADPGLLKRAALVLVTVKGGATAEMADLLAAHVTPGVPVVSLQNGIANTPLLRAALPQNPVLAGMVPYNVSRLGPAHLHRGSAGCIRLEAGHPGLVERLTARGLALAEEADIEAVQWGKLLINLNNALNALSGLPLRDQLRSPPWRRLLAAQISEAMMVLAKAKVRVRSPLAIPLPLLPILLRLPALPIEIVKMDAKARSSMWDDLERRRLTEIDLLQGEILALARRLGIETPVIAAVAEAIRRAETANAGPPGLRPEDVVGMRQLLADRYAARKK